MAQRFALQPAQDMGVRQMAAVPRQQVISISIPHQAVQPINERLAFEIQCSHELCFFSFQEVSGAAGVCKARNSALHVANRGKSRPAVQWRRIALSFIILHFGFRG